MPHGFADAETEYKKNKDLKKADVAALKEWAERQPHLPKLTDIQLILFLHSCYYSNEQAKTTIDNFYTVRTHCPEFFANRNPHEASAQEIYLFIYTPLPKPAIDGSTIIYARLMDFNAEKYNIALQVKSFDMTTMLHLAQSGTSPGLILLCDFTGVTLGHLARASILGIKKFMYYLQECLPIRIKGLHFINIVPFMDKVMALIKPFMKKELMNVMVIHSNIETIYPYMSKECFPHDLGGTAPSIRELFESQRRNFEDNAQYFIDEQKYVVDESRRPGKPKNAGEIFGVEGTFKKLDID